MDKKWSIAWLLSIAALPLVFSYFYFDGYYFKAENMVPLVLVSIFLWYLYYKSKITNKEIKFIIDGEELTKITPGTEVSLSMKDIYYLSIYRNEGKEPNTVDTTDDSGTVNFGEDTFNFAVLLIKTNRGAQMTIKLSFISFEKLRLLTGAILSSVETTKDSVEGYEMLQSMYNSKDIGSALGKASIASMSERNKAGVDRGRMWTYLMVSIGIALGLLSLTFLFNRWVESQI